MVFNAGWNAISYDGGGFRITGDNAQYQINWGDGSFDTVQLDRDENGDGTFDSANPFHFYSQDGTYDVSISQELAGLPPIRFKAFMYSSETDDISLGGSRLGDIMTAGSGNDFLRGADGNDVIGGGDGQDKINGGDGDDFLLGGHGDDIVNGGNGSDLISGDIGADRLSGGGDRDYIYGDAGADIIKGDDGDDYLDGGAGTDRLTGGAGADQFEFAPIRDGDGNALPSDPDRDVVTDYVQGVDHLSVDQWFADGFTLIGTSRFSGAGNEVRFANLSGATIVFGDVDGDKVADFSFKIDGVVTLTNADFVI